MPDTFIFVLWYSVLIYIGIIVLFYLLVLLDCFILVVGRYRR